MIVYLVVISNQVSSDRERLGQIAGEIVSAEQKTAALKPYDDFAKAAAERHDAVASVAKARFKWDRTLTEIARVAPDNVWLTSMEGTLAPDRRRSSAAVGHGAIAHAVDQARRLRRTRAQRPRLHRPSAPHDGRHRGRLQPRGEARQEGRDGAGTGGDCFNNDTKAAKFELVDLLQAAAGPGRQPPRRPPRPPTPGAARSGGRNHPSHGACQPDRRGNHRRLTMTTTNDTRTIAVVVLAGIAILAALWMLAISPKREERTQVKANVAAQEARLADRPDAARLLRGRQAAVPGQARRAQAARQGRAGSRRDLVAAASAAAPGEGAQQPTCASWL